MTDVGAKLRAISERISQEFERARRRLSYREYLELFAADPIGQSRDASTYLKSAFDYFGSETVSKPWGKHQRFLLFDQAFDSAGAGRADTLVGQEAVQEQVYRSLCNFEREGRANRLVLLHGPNGSAKSTAARCIHAGLEHYSQLDAGALYRFHWVFPSKETLRGQIGFADRASTGDVHSYAHLSEPDVEARLMVEMRDHPLFLLPSAERTRFMDEVYEAAGVAARRPHWIAEGALSRKNQQVYEALLIAYDGDIEQVLRHVQVERYYLSRRYRVGAVTLGPQMSLDAGERQVTADQNLSALPASLQSLSLFEAYGELIDASGGVLEFSDLLKRPLETFRYLQSTIETGEVPLRSQTVQLNCVFIGSANEVHLDAFREHPEFESFRGRLELVRAAYLLSWRDEELIYKRQIVPQVLGHVAPYATRVAAMFAVMTRLAKPDAAHFERRLGELVEGLTALEKCSLYATGEAPRRLDEESCKLLQANVGRLYREFDSQLEYEGGRGASPREMRSVLLNAAASPDFEGLSPFAVLRAIDALCERVSEYAWLAVEPQEGGYGDHVAHRKQLRAELLDWLEDDFRVCSGVVPERSYTELFERYVTHVSYWTKGEQLRNLVSGKLEPADDALMGEVEALLGMSGDSDEYRRNLISRVAAWAIERPSEAIRHGDIFQTELRRLREAVFGERRVALAKTCQDVWSRLREQQSALGPREVERTREVIRCLTERFGYDESSCADAAHALMKERFADCL